jgi:iron complex outermembrane receptor protein
MRKNAVIAAIAAAMGIVLGVNGRVAMAQQAADQTAQAQQLERIEVTGTNIRRTDTETPSEIQVITADDLKKSGYTTVSEVLRNISANNQGTLSQAFSGSFAAGASGVALRGLTVGATLVLIDGHRSAPYPLTDDGQRTFVDVSSVPFDTIDHIEILKDGASAIYGSDAIAGVVNVILKKSLTGSVVNAEAGISAHGDGETTHVSFTHGFGDLAADGYTGYASIEYRHQDEIPLINRPGMLTNRDYTPWGGVNAANGVANAFNGGYPVTLGGYTVSTSTGAITGMLGSCQATNAYGPDCPWFNNSLQIQPATQNINLLSKFTLALGRGWQLGLTGFLFDSAAQQVGGYSTTNGVGFTGLFGIKAGPGVPIPTIYPPSGPYLPTVPTTGDYLFSVFTGAGPNTTLVDTQTYRLLASLSGEKWGWDLDFTLGYNKADLGQTVYGDINVPGVQSLVAANPTASAAQLNAVLQSAANNPIISPTQYANARSAVDYLQVKGSRELFKLPNGNAVNVALGAEYTYHLLDALAPGGVAAGTVTGNDAYAVGVQNVASAYVELEADVLRSLEVSLAGRYDHVDTYGSSTTPKVGLKYTPVSQFSLRATYAQGFRAPNPAESGNAGQAFLYTSISDPLLCPGGGLGPTDFSATCGITPTFFQEANPKLQPERSDSYTAGFVFEPVRGYSATLDYYNITLKDQITSATNAEALSTIVQGAVRGPPGQVLTQENGNSAAIPFGLIEFIPVPYLNANSVKTTGIDVDLRARVDLHDVGVFSTDFNATRLFDYLLTTPLIGTMELAGTHGPSGVSGDTGTPQNRFVWTFDWEKGPVDVAATINYISSFSVIDPSVGEGTCQEAIALNENGTFLSSATVTPNLCRVASFTDVDLSARYDLAKGLAIHASITNLFNREAPLDLETYGGSNYNPSLHQAGAVGRFYNLGFTYAF